MQKLEACLVIGCNGHVTKENFVFCFGVETIVLDLSGLEPDKHYEVIKFLDHGCDLFDYPMNDYNKCINTITMLYRDFSAINQELLYNIQKFLRMHRDCGVRLSLVPKEVLGNE